jgi:hypothetical protein
MCSIVYMPIAYRANSTYAYTCLSIYSRAVSPHPMCYKTYSRAGDLHLPA